VSTDTRKEGDGWIGVDFDGTLAHYDHFRGDDHTGAPVDEMVKRVRVWLTQGKDVRLFTARKPSPSLRRWMKEHLGRVLVITSTKDRFMQALYDDRAVQVKRNTGKTNKEDEAQVWQK
jgi:hypothetical protein